MFTTLEECIAAWEQAGQHGDARERIERNARWIPYYAYLASQRDESAATIDPHAEEVTDYLFDRGLLTPDSSVLDIGSGTGSFAHAFAKRCKAVTALEMDAVSQHVCQAQAEQMGISNISQQTEMWETYRSDHRFDFVFSSMCPAICNYSELQKYESLSNHACGILAVTRGSYDLHRKRLMQLLGVHPTGGMTTEALWYYEALYLAGKQPDVRCWSRHFAYTLPMEEVLFRNERYFEIFGIAAADSRPILTQYFQSIATNGQVNDETLLNTALVTWRVE